MSRLFLAKLFSELKVLLPLFALFLLVLNLSISKDSFENAKERLLQNSSDVTTRRQLVTFFLLNNEFALAEKEAIPLSNLPLLTMIDYLKNEPIVIHQELLFWQKISASYPLYRDAHLKFAILALKTNRPFVAKRSLDTAYLLDPTYPLTNSLLRLL